MAFGIDNDSASPQNSTLEPPPGLGRGRGTRGIRGVRGDRGARGTRGGHGITVSSQSRTNARPSNNSPSKPSKPAGPPQAETPATLPVPTTDPKSPGETDSVEPDVCFICASEVIHQCLAPCNHRTCHICGLRMRALYKNKDCAHCRTPASFVIFTDNSTKRFEDFQETDFEKTHDNLGIKYEKTEIYDDTVLLLQYNCPDSSCAHVCRSWDDLYHHVRSVHRKNICKLCLKYKKVFAHEHELFSFRELQKHERFGDDNPGAVDQSGFKGHPECGFCMERFYGDDELFAHCRDKHEKCHICERQNSGSRPQYYLNYDELERHFEKDHFICQDRECLEKKFVVFGSEMDLKGHQLEAHPNGLSKDARRDARKVDISTFDYRTGYQEPRGSRRAGRGRGRDPNVDPIPASSAQPLRRDELAYQRQMDLLNRQTPPQAPPSSTPQIRPSFSTPVVQMEQMNINTTPSPDLTPQQQARQIQHNAVIARAATLLKNDNTKIEEFRKRVSSYRTSNISATELIDGFFQLFDCSSADMGKLVKELADIYENQAKRDGLLQAWNDWRAINEDYPSLPGIPEGIQSTSNSTSTAGRRILRLKSSTAQSSRSATNRQVAWAGGSEPSATPGSNAMAFPSLSTANRMTSSRGTASWATTPASRSTNQIVRSMPASKTGGVDAFPALPAASRPSTHQLGVHRGKVGFWDEKAPTSGNPWSNGLASAGSSTPASGAASDNDELENSGKAKKGKKAKQTLLKYG